MKTRSSYFSDYLIAIAVVVCTLALLAGLAAALTGFRLGKPGRTLHVDFPDVAGIHQHSQVRYAGAPAGSVIAMRHLTHDERVRSPNPENAVRVTVSLRESVPAIPGDVIAVLGADTLLSEKFIGLNAGTPGGPLLADGATIQGLAQPTFDDLIRNAGDLVRVLNDILPKVKKQVDDLLPKIAAISDTGSNMAKDIQTLLAKAGTLMDNLMVLSGSGNQLAGDAKVLLGRANKLIAGSEVEIERTLKELPEVLDHLDTLLGRTQGLLGTNEKDLNATIRDLRMVMQDMRVVAVHAKKVTAALAGGHPTRLIWTKDDKPPPSDTEILGGRQPAGQARPQKPAAPAPGKR